VVYWDADARKDLLIGQADGTLKIFRNVGTEEAPHFDGGTFLQVGEPGFKSNINVGGRATPIAVDWNEDGKKDLVVGAVGGRVHLFLNQGLDEAPDFRVETFAQEDGADLIVPTSRSSPEVLDLTDDGKKDLLTGNTAGQLLLYANTGTNEVPTFSGFVLVEAEGVPIDLPFSPRTRPFVAEWTGDGFPDVLLGAGDGLVRLYRGEDPTGVPGNEPSSPGGVARLFAAYPNPFHPVTTIPFALSKSERVRVSVHDAAGRRVAHVGEGVFPEGAHRMLWRGVDDGGRPVPSGIYFVRMETRETVKSEKVTLVR
jgi:hypothetical protein